MDKSYVTLAQHVCPACGKPHDTGELLLDTRLRARFDMHTTVGWGLCPEHQKMVDAGYRLFVEIDENKSDGFKAEEVWRTGPIAGVRTEVADELMPTSKNQSICWVQPEVMALLEAKNKEAKDVSDDPSPE